jgi:hypothetical protein
MKKQNRGMKAAIEKDTMRPEYDFSKGVRGKHAAKYAAGTNVVVLEPGVAREFRTSEQVNETLRAVSKLLHQQRKRESQAGIIEGAAPKPRNVVGPAFELTLGSSSLQCFRDPSLAETLNDVDGLRPPKNNPPV